MSDQSSEAFFARVNEDKIQQLNSENESLKQKLAAVSLENEQMKRALSAIKDQSELSDIMKLTENGLAGTSVESGDFLAQIRADLLEDEAMKIDRAAYEIESGSQDLDEAERQASEGYVRAAKQCSLNLKKTANNIRAKSAH